MDASRRSIRDRAGAVPRYPDRVDDGADAWLFKVVKEAEWGAVRGPWAGTALDRRDGYVHLSGARQVPGTLARHFPGATDLLLLWIPRSRLAQADLRFEPSRGGGRFPHLYGTLDPAWVARIDPLPLDPDGRHRLPPGMPSP